MVNKKEDKMKFKYIKEFPNIHYRVNVPLDYVSKKIKEWESKESIGGTLEINPDFQRGNVWTEKQQIKYMEYLLKNASSGKEIYFNHPNWMGSWEGSFVLVDGLQRLTAVLNFLNNKIKVYNTYYKNYEDKLPISLDLIFNIATLKTREEVLQWYLDFNTGGTIHSKEEIKKVKRLLDKERRIK